MNLTINVPDEQEPALKARALARGLSPEEFAGQVIAQELGESAAEPFWRSFTRQMHSLPDEVFEQLPSDGASEHDHYLYGSPRRNQQ